MNVAIYAKGLLGKKIIDYIHASDSITIVGVVEDSLPFTSDTGLTLAEHFDHYNEGNNISFIELIELYQLGKADAVIVASDNELSDYIIKRLSEHGIHDIALVPSYYVYDYDITDYSFMWVDTSKPRMPYLEYHISFHCNLKCAGCTHFSNIISSPRFGNIDKFRHDLARLQELFWGIGKIRLMGGEPLLNPDLPQFIIAARDSFPDADIRVVSNGLLLREEHSDILDSMRDNAVLFDISMYPPTQNIINNVSKICNEHNVILTVTPDISEFTAGMNLTGMSDPEESYKSCPAGHCTYLCDGYISTCAMPQLIDIYNSKYKAGITPAKSDIIDLYDETLDGYELLNRLKRPMNICRFCDSSRRSYDWFVSPDPVASEWIGKPAERSI
ncbi:4Fe-4S single cluster domain-containing protein [Lachnospiraceae bacterium XBB2008]|nr:4Fe-4S single cluster domain-containing protein [Lachnospiraceae bacterium XBB2008]